MQSERWSVAWDQGAYHWPFPEVYHNSGLHSPPWQQLSLYGVLNSQAAGQFLGVLVQHQACLDEGCDPLLDNDAEQGFTELWEELNEDPATASYIGWTSDISWQWMSPPAIN